MEYKITRWATHNMMESTGDDMCMFDVFLTMNNEPEFARPVSIDWEELMEHIKATTPEEYNYIKKIRENMNGYGPKHSKVMAILEEEGYDFFKHLQSYVTPAFAEDNYEYNHRPPATPQAAASLEAAMLELDSYADALKEENIRATAFLDAVDQSLHEITLKYYPELFEKGQKKIEAYKDALVRATMNFADAIDRLNYRD